MDHSKFEELVPTPNPEDYLMDSATDLSWIMEMLEEKQVLKLQSENRENQSYSSALGECSLPNSNLIPDIVPSTSSAVEVVKDQKNVKDTSSPGQMNLDRMAVEKSNSNSWRDNRWNPVSRNSELWPSQTVSCYSTQLSQTIGSIFFFVDGGESADWTPSPTMKVTVLDENENQTPVEMRKELASHLYICKFPAFTPGFYSVAVCDGLLGFHVKGSPFQISVARNYKMSSSWMKPRLFCSKAVKSWGIAYSLTARRVYVTDRHYHHIIIYHENGSVEKCFGVHGQEPDQLFRPTGIAVDNLNQRLVVTDKDNHRVSIYTLDGQYLFGFGGKGYKDGEFNYPWGVSVSPKDSSIVIADSRNYRIQLFDSKGNFLRKYSVFETSPFEFKTEFNCPRGVAFDKTGQNVYVTDFNIQTVFKLSNDLTEKSIIVPFGVSLRRPQGMTIDALGNLLVCDSRNNRIRVFSPTGEYISSIVGNAADSFLFPQDLTVVPTGEILVVDSRSNIRVL